MNVDTRTTLRRAVATAAVVAAAVFGFAAANAGHDTAAGGATPPSAVSHAEEPIGWNSDTSCGIECMDS
ncbi:hypothetical protein [Actinoplanes sp. NPDC049118]|uniref:hypothetical protein n=1 Tax=Actinoplanes sp. NPDC049118 TaxID=3155769 RepID=UPI003409C377